MKQEIHFTKYLGKQTQSVNEIWLVYVILQKKKIIKNRDLKISSRPFVFGNN